MSGSRESVLQEIKTQIDFTGDIRKLKKSRATAIDSVLKKREKTGTDPDLPVTKQISDGTRLMAGNGDGSAPTTSSSSRSIPTTSTNGIKNPSPPPQTSPGKKRRKTAIPPIAPPLA
ncbi:unnamed protein product, partial [Amoebophrya sp. A120]|eukprot:GSA120T00004957001.1